ncbi:hypothetical protein BGZ65_004352, partial [Modicella reniformis]
LDEQETSQLSIPAAPSSKRDKPGVSRVPRSNSITAQRINEVSYSQKAAKRR